MYDIPIQRLQKRTRTDNVKVIRGKRFLFNTYQYTNVGKCIYMYIFIIYIYVGKNESGYSLNC